MAAGLKKKLGPLPVWAWGLLVVAILGYWLFFRRSNQGTTATTGAADTNQSLLFPQGNAGQVNAAQAGQPSTASPPADSLSPDVLSALQGANSDLVNALVNAQANAYNAGAYAFGTSTGSPLAGAAGASQPAATVATPTATEAGATPAGTSGGAKVTQPFGGIVSKRKLSNGGTLTTYANGRQVEQAPGHSPYVVKAGR